MHEELEKTLQQEVDIAHIRTAVLRKFPLLGVTMSHLETVAKENIGTAATDGNIVYYSPQFFEKLSDEQKTFVYAHEVMHVAFNHILRSKDRDHRLWNIATDSVINQILKSEGLPMVEGGVDIAEAIGHSAEEMYEKLLKEKEEKQNQKDQDGEKDKQQSGGGEGDEKDQNESEQAGHDNHEIWKEAVKQAEKKEQEAKQNSGGEGEKDQQQQKTAFRQKPGAEPEHGENESKASGGDIEKNFADENRRERRSVAQKIREALETEKDRVMAEKTQGAISFGDVGTSEAVLNWKKILKKTIEQEQSRWSYRRSNEDNDYMARVEDMDEDDKGETEVMLDVSGSVSNDFLKEFLRQLKPILKDSKLKVGCFDEHFYGLKEVKTNDDIDNFEIIAKSRWTENWDLAVKSFSKRKDVNKIVFTDGHPQPGKMPDESTRYINVIWLVYGNKDFKPICGKVIQVDPDLQSFMTLRMTRNMHEGLHR